MIDITPYLIFLYSFSKTDALIWFECKKSMIWFDLNVSIWKNGMIWFDLNVKSMWMIWFECDFKTNDFAHHWLPLTQDIPTHLYLALPLTPVIPMQLYLTLPRTQYTPLQLVPLYP